MEFPILQCESVRFHCQLENMEQATRHSSLTFNNQDGRGGQAVHISVNNADIFPSMVQLDVPNHQIPRYTLKWSMIS